MTAALRIHRRGEFFIDRSVKMVTSDALSVRNFLMNSPIPSCIGSRAHPNAASVVDLVLVVVGVVNAVAR